MAKSEELLSIWNKACEHYHVPEQVAYTWYERIRNKLNESGDNRIYHNWSDMLMPKSKDLANCKPHIVVATFFQYYDFDLAKSCVNVNKNCQVFREFCQDALIEDEQMKENVCYLLGEKGTSLISADIEEDAAVLQDLDLIILAAPPELYKRYAELSRREWCALGESNYNHLRKKFYLDNKPSTSAQAQLAKETNDVLNNKFANSPLSNKYSQRNKLPKYDNTIYYRKALKRCLGVQTTPKEKILPQRQMKWNKKLKQSFQGNPKRNTNASEDGNQPKPKRKKPNNSTLKIDESPTQQANISITLEEGEIGDTDDALRPHNSIDNNKEEDCICIEPQIESIVIEDDTPCNNEPLPLDCQTLLNSFCQRMTSTPQRKNKRSPPTKQKKPSVTMSNIPLPFYEDVLGSPLFRFRKSPNTQYNNKLSALGWKYEAPREKALGKDKENTNNNDKNNINYNNVHDDVIVLDDTNVTLTSTSNQTLKSNDDSVVFVSETKKTEFIPLSSKDVPNPITVPVEFKTPIRKRHYSPDLFTASEKKSLNAYNSNTYNPNTGKEQTKQKRMIIIDGSNVAYSHSLNKNFSVKGVKIVVTYFEKMGHEVKVVVPQFRLGRYKCTEPEELERLHGEGKIVFTPCKKLPGKSSTCYDDRFILQLACELDAVIVSNDNYRDLIHENAAFKKIVENRVVGYTWCNDIFILPKDPYGKWGPPLSTILNRL